MADSNKKRREGNKLRLRVKKHRAISEVVRSTIEDSSDDDSNNEHEDIEDDNIQKIEQLPEKVPDFGADHFQSDSEDSNHLHSSEADRREDETSEGTFEEEVGDGDSSSSSSSSSSEFDESSGTSDSDDSSDDDEVGVNVEEENAENEEVAEYNDADDHLEIQQLREWAVKCKIHLSHMDDLLAILRVRLLPDLPKTAKTFLGTTGSHYNIIPMQDSKGSMGEFVYLGVAKGLQACINADLHPENKIELQINADGLPLTKSGFQTFWPILCKVHCNPDVYEPFPVAIYSGDSKPADLNLYLAEFVDEINNLQRYGIEIGGNHFQVSIKCFICDTPARAFLKSTIGHTGRNACERCTVVGAKVESRTVFPNINAEEKTDESFRSRNQVEHHHGITALLRIVPFLNMISIFVLDSMHLLYQGMMKKLLEYWVEYGGNKLNVTQRNELSRRMKLLKRQVPCEFQHKPRSTDHLAKWKATQFRFFTLYAGPIVLKEILISTLYKHFLLFHVACRILCSDRLCKKYWGRAKQYLILFFSYLSEYYGPSSQVLNAHHLIHLADDAFNMGCSLSRVTAFPFESLLGQIKKYLRTPYRPLAQLCRRLHEQFFVKNKKPAVPPLFEILEENENWITKIKYKEFEIRTTSPNNIVLMKDKTIIKVKKMRRFENSIMIRGKVWEKKKSLFTFPIDSGHLNMWRLNTEASNNVLSYDITLVDCKLVRLSINMKEESAKKTFVIPLLHG